MTLIEKIRQARVVRVTVGAMVFIAKRPTVEEFASIYRDGLKDPDIARKYVTGWEGVRECDLFKGGGDDVITFDADVWAEVIGDHPKVWGEIAKCLLAATQAHIKSLGEAEKNLTAG